MSRKMTRPQLTTLCGTFIASLAWQDIPDKAIEVAKLGITDCLAVMLAGRSAKAVEILVNVLGQSTPSSRSNASLEVARLSWVRSADAALINGTAAHVLDFDDIGISVQPAHPSAVLVPTILSLIGPTTTGADLLLAYIAGYEIWAELACRESAQHLEKGWHATAVFGTLASAAAASKMLGLSALQSATALSIAASKSGGLVANFGSMTKPLHVGMAASAGVFAGQLAQQGFTASADVLESEKGFLTAFSPSGLVDWCTDTELGRVWRIIKYPLGIKKYPVCYALHRVVDAAVQLGQRLPLPLFELASIDVVIGAKQRQLLPYDEPHDLLQAKFSIPFSIAIALSVGELGLEQLSKSNLVDEGIRELMDKVRVTTCDQVDPSNKTFSPYDKVTLQWPDGEKASTCVRYALGHPSKPITSAAHATKFFQCMATTYTEHQTKRLYDMLISLEQLDLASELLMLLKR